MSALPLNYGTIDDDGDDDDDNNDGNNNGTSDETTTPLAMAFARTRDALARDVPLLLHGSGDVNPPDVSRETCQLVAALTAQYVSELVDAALDSQQMLCDGGVFSASSARSAPARRRRRELRRRGRQQVAVVPPAAFPHPRAPPVPIPPSKEKKGKKRRAKDEFWDEPLPEPRIRSKIAAAAAAATATTAAQHGSAVTEVSGSSISNNNGDDDDDAEAPTARKVHVDEWVGAAGVDLFESSRARSAYVRGPSALTTQNFIFPVAHDTFAYGRVLEIQNARRQTQSLLVDPVVAELVRTEGQKLHHHRKLSKSKKKQQQKGKGGGASGKEKADGTSDPEDEDVDDDEDDAASEGGADDEDGPMWPGLEYILPVHRGSLPPAP